MKRFFILLMIMIIGQLKAQTYDAKIKDMIRKEKYDEALIEINNDLRKVTHDTTKIGLTFLKGGIYQKKGDFLKAIKILKTIDENKANINQLILLNSLYGVLCFNFNKIDSGIIYTNKSIQLIEKYKLNGGKAYNNISFMYQVKGDTYNQLKYIIKAYEEFLREKNQEGLVSTTYALGNYYFENDDIIKAESYLLKGIYSNDLRAKSFAGFHQVLSQIYALRGDYTKAIKFAQTALKIDLRINNIQGQGLTNGLLGRYYFDLKKYKEALEYTQKGLRLSKESLRDNQTAEIYSNEGQIYWKTNNIEKAITSYKSALELSNKLNLYNIGAKANKALSDIYKTQKKYSSALPYFENYKIANDSVIASENTKKSKFLLAQFEAEQKDRKILEQELSLSQEKVKSNKFKIGGLIISLLVCILILALIYNRNRNRHKIAEILNLMQVNLQEFQDSIKLAFNQSPTELSLVQVGDNPLTQLFQGDTIKEDFLSTSEKSVIENIKKQTYKISKELENRISKVKTFSYSISHDLRQPIRQALLLAQDIDKSNPTVNEIKEYVRQASDLVDCYTALAEIEAYELNMQCIDLGELMKSEIRKVKKLDYFPENCEINVGELASIWGDTLLVRQVIWNLLSNAVKYSSCRPMVKVSILLESTDKKETIISVSDNGIGFSPLIGDRLFLPFIREESSKKYSGFGIGLALCKQIVEKLGGRIWGESDGKSGAKFFVAFKSI